MSFGFSIGDFAAIGQLSWKIYRSCKSAPNEFQELSRELNTLHTLLLELSDEANSPTSLLNRRGVARKVELDVLVENLVEVLRQIEDIVERYHSLGRDQKRTWDRVGFATEDLTSLRGKLAFHVVAIELFITSLSAGSLARIEGILDELVRDIKAGRQEPTIISASEDDNSEVAWAELERELVGDGITKQDVERYKEDIKDYLRKLIQDNLVDFSSNSSDSLSIVVDDLEIMDGTPEREVAALSQWKNLPTSRASRAQTLVIQRKPLSSIPDSQKGPVLDILAPFSESPEERSERLPWKFDEIKRQKKIIDAGSFENARIDTGTMNESEVRLLRRPTNPKSNPDVKSGSFKDLLNLAITSTKPTSLIYWDINRVLSQHSVSRMIIHGGYFCFYDPRKDDTVLARNQSRVLGSLVVGFELFVIKVPMLSLHGIGFNRLFGDKSQYIKFTNRILHELRTQETPLRYREDRHHEEENCSIGNEG